MYISIPFLWFYIGTYDRNVLRNDMYDKGRNLSQKLKPIPYWDKYAEPIIIRQFSNIFTAGNSFIKGLISDNDDQDSLNTTIEQYKHEIDDELDTLNDKSKSVGVLKLSPMEPID